jgi:DNA-binding NarL/FixJ family response regulator
MERIKVIIADDHLLVRAGIRALLEQHPDLEVVAEASNGREALNLIRKHKPTVVLMDIAMPELNGLEAIRQLSKESSETRSIILSMYSDEEHVWQALQAGAAGYLVKGGALAELELAIKAVARGHTYLSPGVSRPVIKEYVLRTGGGSAEGLTPRQREILQMIAEGKPTKQIALILNVSVKTIESHRSQLMKRLAANDIATLVRHAVRLGLVGS